MDIYPEEPDVIRWTKDNGQSWVEGVPIVNGEAAIENGIKLIIHDFEDKKYGCTAVFACESKREAEILSISGNEIELSVVATVGERCRLAHSDSVAFQRAVDLAIERGGTVYIPNGEYKLTSSVVIKDAGNVQIIGESGAGVIIRNSDMPYTFSVDNHTSGPCFKVIKIPKRYLQELHHDRLDGLCGEDARRMQQVNQGRGANKGLRILLQLHKRDYLQGS